MEIYDRRTGQPSTQKPTNTGYVNVTNTGVYINSEAGRAMKLTRNKQIVYGKRYKSLMIGIADKNNPKVSGWKISVTGNSASAGAPSVVRAKFPRGKYTIENVEKKNDITWYKLAKKK